jgi:hypothetical protein
MPEFYNHPGEILVGLNVALTFPLRAAISFIASVLQSTPPREEILPDVQTDSLHSLRRFQMI